MFKILHKGRALASRGWGHPQHITDLGLKIVKCFVWTARVKRLAVGLDMSLLLCRVHLVLSDPRNKK
jgi:hypothetical protein